MDKKRFRRLDFLGHCDYMVSSHGELYTWRGDYHRKIPYRWVKVKLRGTGRIPYVRVRLGKKSWLMQRLVLEAFVGPCPPGCEARHFPDRNPQNNRLDNLQWGTKKENAADKTVHGTSRKGVPNHGNAGSKNGRAAFTDDQVRAIRAEYRDEPEATYRSIGAKYGRSHWTIMEIVTRRTYADVE